MKRRLALILVSLMLLMPIPVEGSIAQLYSFDEMWSSSDYVFTGTVTRITTHLGWDLSIYRIGEITIEDRYKSQVENMVCIRMLGGEIGPIGIWVEDQPELRTGGQYLLLTSETGKTHRGHPIVKVANMIQGVFPLNEATGAEPYQIINMTELDIKPLEIMAPEDNAGSNERFQQTEIFAGLIGALILLYTQRGRLGFS